MVIQNIAGMVPGTSKITTVQFNTDVGFFRWNPQAASSMRVYVLRDTQQSWTISTDPILVGAGDVAALVGNKNAVLGYRLLT